MADQYSVRLDIQYETIKGLKTALAEANKELENAKINTVEWTNALKKIGELKMQMADVTNAMKQTVVATQQTSKASANAGMALLNLNYVIRDSPYFFNNFALGVLAVGNNLNPLIDSFARVRQEAGAKSLSTFALLRQALVGGAGLSIAFSVVVTAIQAFVFWQAKSNKESESGIKTSEDLANAIIKQAKGVDELKKAYEQLNTEQLVLATAKLNEKLQEQYNIIRERLDLTLIMGELGGPHLGLLGKILGYDVDLTEDEIKTLKEIRENLDAIEKVQEVKKGRIPLLREEIKSLTELRDAIPEGDSLNVYDMYNNRIKELQKELDRLTGNLKEVKKEFLEAGDATKRFFREMANFPGQGFGREAETTESRGQGAGVFGTDARPQRDRRASGIIKNTMKEFQVHLEIGKILANELGNALDQAFMQGKFALDQFIKSLISAITQMLILRTITNFLTFGLAGGANAVTPLPAVIPKSGLSKQGVVRVTGKITADKNNFIANIRNADNYYSRNEEFLVVGR